MGKRIYPKETILDIEAKDELLVSSEVYPRTHSLDLATHPAVANAWEHFFALCWDWWEEVERRRKRAEETRTISQLSEVPEDS
ncbi:hypothetical protein LC607_35285 [Nostoc sp. CHAB 5824]|nr:hypothetical protein [Nostoc sp. CHAB 5824]